jgi:ubiquinone/menaquinone biosynthesis C-methylase UbiE
MNSLPQADYQSSEPLNIRSRMQEKFSQRQVNWYRWVGETIHLKPSSRILDLGCGSGGYWLVNERLVSRQAAVLLDTSPAMLHECQLILGHP